MNTTKIEWTDCTWNPVTGCRHKCEYCYARKVANRFGVRISDESDYPVKNGGVHLLEEKVKDNPYPYLFEPTFRPFRLKEPQQKKKPLTIFVCSMADLFGRWVPDSWIEDVLRACEEAPQHRYLFLTKNPKRYVDLYRTNKLPIKDNMWYGASATNEEETKLAAYEFKMLPTDFNKFLSIEPLHTDIANTYAWAEMGFGAYVDWVIIGSETGNRKDKVIPKKEWIYKIISDCDREKNPYARKFSYSSRFDKSTPVFMKDSVAPIIGEENMRRELPWER